MVGISPDSKETLLRYVSENNLPFTFASDTNKSLAEAWGAKRRITGGTKRLTFVVASGGKVHRLISHEILIFKHIADAINDLKSMR